MSRSSVFETMMGAANSDSHSSKRNAIAIHRRYLTVKQQLSSDYTDSVLPYRLLVRGRMAMNYIENPLLAGATLIETLNLTAEDDRHITDLILCAAVDLCLESSIERIADTMFRGDASLH